MKTAHLFLASSVAFISALTPICAEEDSPAAIQMQQIGKSFKTLSIQISDPAKKDSSLKIIDNILQGVNSAKPLVPTPATELSGESLKAYLNEYAKGLSELEASLQDLKKAIVAGDTSAAQSLISSINKIKKTYHSDLK